MRRRLIKEEELGKLMAVCHAIEGTERHVLELLAFGADYSSYYLLLRSRAALDDPAAADLIGKQPSRFGKALVFGRDLERDSESGTVYFVGDLPGEKAS